MLAIWALGYPGRDTARGNGCTGQHVATSIRQEALVVRRRCAVVCSAAGAGIGPLERLDPESHRGIGVAEPPGYSSHAGARADRRRGSEVA